MSVDLVITCDHLFDGRQLVENAVVVVEGERIASVQTNGASNGAAWNGAQRLHSRFLMPGLVDAHLHLFGHGENPPIGAPFALVENFMRLLMCNGITTVRDAGNAIETIRYCQHWSHENDGPRIFPTGPLLDAPPLMWAFSRIVNDPEEARQEVHRLKVEGLEWVSLYHNVSLDVARATIDAAREQGLHVVADVRGIEAVELVEAGVTSIEHGHNLLLNHQHNGTPTPADELMMRWSTLDLHSDAVKRLTDSLLEHKTFLCPTLLVTHRWCSIENMVSEPNLEYMVAVMSSAKNFLRMRQPMGMMIGKRVLQQHLPISNLSRGDQVKVRKGLNNLKALTRQLHEAGVPLVAGTDAPSPSIVPGFSLHQELALLVESGLAPTEALTCATAEAARLLHRQDELGCIKPGALADLLLIDGNPAERIEETRKIETVVKGGRLVDRKPMIDAVRAKLTMKTS